MNKKAFTLIELLVVIAIVGIMVGIITPVLNRAREGARASQCSNNLRQIGMAFHMYVDDHDFKFPHYITGGLWYQKLDPYIKDIDVFECPDYKYHNYGTGDYFSYGYNWNAVSEKDINVVKSPSQCILVYDSSRYTTDGPNNGRYTTYKATHVYSTRHSNGLNIVFVDGHVGWSLTADIPMSGAESTLWWNY